MSACQGSATAAPSELVARAEPPLLPDGEEPIRVSDAAVAKVAELLAEEGDPGLQLRIYVSGGGCSGFQYGFAFDDEFKEDDIRVARAPITVVVDAMSLQYLVGAEIDYEDTLDGARFVIRNPNAVATCGCGSSFSV